MRGGLSVGIALACLFCGPLADAAAQDADAPAEGSSETERRAQTHFEAGRNHYGAGAYERAIGEFEAAYELSPKPLLLYNLYLARERAGHLEEAAGALRAYLDQGDVEPELRQTLRTRLDNLERRLEERAASEQQGEGQEHDGGVDGGDDGAGAAATAPGAARSDDGGGLPTSAVVSFVVGGVGLATFAVFAGLSESEDRSVANDCGVDSGKSCSGGDVSTLKTYNIIADVALGVGLAAAATGVILWLVDDGGEPEAGDVAVAPWIGRERAGAAAEVRF